MLSNESVTNTNNHPNRFLSSIEAYETVPIVSLERAIESLVPIVPHIEQRTLVAKTKCQNPAEHLSIDESAAICLYSMEWTPYQQSIYFLLNAALREREHEQMKPWILFMKLLLTALNRLPSKFQTVFRGVKLDLHGEYSRGDLIIWWGFTSCTSTINVLQSNKFLGKKGERTQFIIECINGKNISKHSYFKSENEILLMPGTCFQVISFLDHGHDFYTIQLKEIESISPSSVPSAESQMKQLETRRDVFRFGKSLKEKDLNMIVQQEIIDCQCTHLYLKESDLTSRCALILANILHHNTTLKGLYLFNNQIGDSGVQALAMALSFNKNQTLEELSLGCNLITCQGAEYLAQMLITNQTLKGLWLSQNSIDDRGIQTLATVLQCQNRTLQGLSLGWNKQINDLSIGALMDMLNDNQSLKMLDLKTCKISRSGKSRFCDVIKCKKNFQLLI
ncbi:unnamed protein product [Adineta ricciae]|uniref:NAD(P)(+)--arginine ADP-ribosyltransferase n=1 Tax=Adineta ricciae TaxID=249248 RepID=A0A814AKG5_ADIRI|nr:unnamed protein product [Adineta ricciae]CAF1595660.1 unnamed protein product [Adineta ricciae]